MTITSDCQATSSQILSQLHYGLVVILCMLRVNHNHPHDFRFKAHRFTQKSLHLPRNGKVSDGRRVQTTHPWRTIEGRTQLVSHVIVQELLHSWRIWPIHLGKHLGLWLTGIFKWVNKATYSCIGISNPWLIDLQKDRGAISDCLLSLLGILAFHPLLVACVIKENLQMIRSQKF